MISDFGATVFAKLDGRRIVFILVCLTLSLPLLLRWSVPPVPMAAAQKLFDQVEALPNSEAGKIAYVALDYGPGTNAESGSQARAVIEHLMRRRIKFLVTSQALEAAPIINSLPDEVAAGLMKLYPGERWEYGVDWVNVGYTPGGGLNIQSVAKAESLAGFFKRDARGNSTQELPIFRGVKGLDSVTALVQITSLTGTLENYLQFFQTESYRPIFLHACTSIATPQAFIYLDSGQIKGLLEGIAGAAWYGQLLSRKHPERPVDDSVVINTTLGVAHLLVIALILAGNVLGFFGRKPVRA